MWDGWLDLFLGSTCAGCGVPGRLLCAACRDDLPTGAVLAWPTPSPPGLVTPVAAGEYAGLLKALINAHKERQQFALARPLGLALAAAVNAVAGEAGTILVPVPSRGRVVRSRGHDPMLRVSRHAAALLRRDGRAAAVRQLLRPVRAVRDQAGLTADARAANLSSTMGCVPRLAEALLSRAGPTDVIVVDDVITTGATAREAQRALEDAGVPVRAVAVVAATRRLIEVAG